MRRTVTTDDSQAVSLFPFLAVLLSTMGALLLVLVVMARQARLQAAEGEGTHSLRSSAENAEDGVDLTQLQAAATRLEAVRQAGLAELEKSRLRLRHADHHLRQLQDEVARLYQELRALEEKDSHRLHDKEQANRELARLRDLIQDTEQRLEEARRRVAEAPKSYAIVPYEGPHGTTRRPLYIECRRDAVVLQPEGVELDARDFQGPLGPGNPLASALRAAEEYFVANSDRSSEVKPYPLVLVRPDGIAAYYYVRRALEGWSSDFGYELLDGDWQLEFPLPNPQVANLQQRAIDLARARHQALALAAPRRFGGGGGGVASNQDGGEDGPFGGFGSEIPGGMRGSEKGGWGKSGDDQGGATGGPNATPSTGQAASAPPGPDPAAATGQFEGQQDQTGGGSAGEHVAVTQSLSADAVRQGAGGQPGRTASGQFHTAAARGGYDRYSARSATTPTSAGQQDSHAGSPTGAAQSSGPSGPQSGGRISADSQGDASLGGSTSIESLAQVRGSGWAIPEARLGAVPVRRTIHVIVRRDRFAVLPEHGAPGGQVIPVTESVEAAVDPFIETVQERITSWGTAGSGLYWQPILVLQPGPDGTQNAEALRELLSGSGLEIAP